MGNTTNYNLPYPELSDKARVPAHMKSLAERLDTVIDTVEGKADSATSGLTNKVDKAEGKGLSTNDFNNTYKDKVDGIESGAEVNIIENVKLNGTNLVITNKAVNIPVDDELDDESTNPIGNATVKAEVDDLDLRISLLEGSSSNLTLEDISAIVRAGKAQNYFKVGDQITTTWKDTQTNTEYEVPLDIVDFQDVTILDNGMEKTVPGMILQWHFASPFGVQFAQNQAFYVCAEALPAGTYYFEVGNNWGTHCHAGYKYQFTTTQTIPAGGQIQIGKSNSEVSGMPDNAPSTWRIRTYSSADSTTPIEILSVTEYSSGTPTGTSLGSLTTSSKYNTTLNNLYSSAYGHNRWKNSALRQFLNSDATKGNWYTNPNDDVFARKPDQLASKDGFLKGVDPDLLAVIKPVKVTTAINTNRDSEKGTWDYTYDTFFLPSLEQAYCVPQIAGEGTYWPYWKEKSGLSSPNAQNSTNENMITYAVENHSSAQTVRLRSAHRGFSSNTWSVVASGYISGGGSGAYATRFSPACVIC